MLDGMLWRTGRADSVRRANCAADLLANIESDETLTAHRAATAPDVQRAYLDWAVKPRRGRLRRRRANSVLVELAANEQLHYQPRTASWTDVLGF